MAAERRDGVFLDAVVIRSLLLLMLAVLELPGRRTWALPRWLDGILAGAATEPSARPAVDRPKAA